MKDRRFHRLTIVNTAVAVPPVSAEDPPEEPFNMKLSDIGGGIPGEADGLSEMLEKINLSVSGGNVQGSTSGTYSRANVGDVQASLTITGSYSDGSFTGTWTYRGSYKNPLMEQCSGGPVELEGSGPISSDGVLSDDGGSGTISGSNTKREFIQMFDEVSPGLKPCELKSKTKEFSGTRFQISIAPFEEPAPGTGQTDLTYDEKTAEDITKTDSSEGYFADKEVAIAKIYGDVTLSDPSQRRGLLSLSAKALTTLTGWDDDPEPWRVRSEPKGGTPIKEGFQIKTGAGRAVLQFIDGTKFIIREGSTVTFTKSGINMETGNYYFSFVKIGKKIYLQDKRGKWSISGTKFEINSGEQETTLKVYEGAVRTERLNGIREDSVKAGNELKITDNGLGNVTPLTGPSDVNIDGMAREIIDAETSEARLFGLAILGILAAAAAAVLAIIVMLLKRRKSKKAVTG